MNLPSRQICDSLLEIYFLRVHWFSLVVYEPRFRTRYNKIIDTGLAYNADRGFILLLVMLFILGSWYRSRQVTSENEAPESQENLRNVFLKLVREQFMDLMDEDSLEFVQLCTLLGSFYLYHGHPRSSFSILGAATKTAQAIGLHREPEGQCTFEEAEERKRIWWTIYTWDRSLPTKTTPKMQSNTLTDLPPSYMGDPLESTTGTATCPCLARSLNTLILIGTLI